jgi:predicted nucleic acid-binding protein
LQELLFALTRRASRASTNAADFIRISPAPVCPTPDDLHVLAAAAHAKADLIVTINLKDFLSGVLTLHGIVAAHPQTLM